MSPFDRWLVQPTREELLSTLTQAVRVVNRVGRTRPPPATEARARKQLLTDGRGPDDVRWSISPEPDLAEMVQAEARETEGVRLWLPGRPIRLDAPLTELTPRLALAWWTDNLGRRHVRVACRNDGGRSSLRHHRLGPPGRLPPPLWLVYPDHFCLRTRPGREPELIALCRCGDVGPPERLDWMGDCCGPCHDRRDEGGEPLGWSRPHTWVCDTRPIRCLHFIRDGLLVTASTDQRDVRVRFWEWPAGREVHCEAVRRFLPPGLVPFAANSAEAIVNGRDEFVSWNLEAQPVRQKDLSGQQYRSCALSSDGRFLAGLFEQTLRILDRGVEGRPQAGNGRKPREVHVERELFLEAHPLLFTPESDTLAIGAQGGCVSLVDPQTGKVTCLLCDVPRASIAELESAYVRCLAFSPDGSRLAAGCGRSLDLREDDPEASGSVLVWNAPAETPVARLSVPGGSVNAVAFSPDGTVLVSGGRDGIVRFWDAKTWQEVIGLVGHLGAIHALTFSPDGRLLLSGSADGTVRHWPWRDLMSDK